MTEYTRKEELVNWLSHGLATLASLVGIGFLFTRISTGGEVAKWVSIGIYSVSLVMLYSASTLYHFVRSNRWKQIFRIVDHAAIYVKIAGTYTPFLVLALGDYYGWELSVGMWLLAAAGIILKLFFVNKFNLLSTGVYLAMGWLIIVLIKPLYQSLPLGALMYILAGGLCFTVGVSFYLWKKLPYSHSIWHVFVMGGSAFHFTGIYLYLA
ncbi:MAG: hemolysin III family protein [Cyclobacteriaceae bacterium]